MPNFRPLAARSRPANRTSNAPFLAAALLAVIAVSTPAQADPLTFEDALARSRANAPSLQAKALGVDASRAARKAAGALPDPKLTLGIDGFPISGPNAFRPSREDFAAVRIGVSQDIPNPAKRRAQRIRADADIVIADAQAAREERDVEVGTATAWITLAFAQRRVAALDSVRARLSRLVSTTPSAVADGTARPAQTLAGKQAMALLDDRRDQLVAAVARARADLMRWTGDADPAVAGPMPVFAVDGANLRAAVDSNPLLAQVNAGIGRADAEVRLAEAERRPDFGVDVAYQHRDPRFGDMVSAGVTIGLPFIRRDRQNALIAASYAEAGKVRAEQEAARRELTARLDAELADHALHHAQWRRSRDTLEPLARERVDLEVASYGAGRAGLLDVVDAHSALVGTMLDTLDREAMVAIDEARLILTYRSATR